MSGGCGRRNEAVDDARRLCYEAAAGAFEADEPEDDELDDDELDESLEDDLLPESDDLAAAPTFSVLDDFSVLEGFSLLDDEESLDAGEDSDGLLLPLDEPSRLSLR